MVDNLDKEKRSWTMRQVQSRFNKSTELRFIQILKDRGIKGWRRNYPLVGKPDFVFPRVKIAVFIDGCFWHGCPKHCRMPSSNRDYWEQKIKRNVQRDRAVKKELKLKGWEIVRFWEHELRNIEIAKLRYLLGK